jgi:hypothetical protein
MARYGGGGENYDAERAKIDALRATVADLNAKEVAATDAMNALGEAETREAGQARLRSQAKREGAEIDARAARASAVNTEALNVETAAIERNRQARVRRDAIAQREAVNANRAARGANDPLFARAYGYGPEGATQYRLRKDLGVGQGRAQRLQDAVRGGFFPAGTIPATAPRGPLTRLDAARLAVERSEAQLAEANKVLANTRRRESATDADRLNAVAARDAARATRQAARVELQSAEQLAAARGAAAEAHLKEAAAQTAFGGGPGAGVPGRAIIPHPNAAQIRIARTGVEVPGGRAYTDATEGQRVAGGSRAAAAALAAEAQAKGQAARASSLYANALSKEVRAAHDAVYAQAAQAEAGNAAAVTRTAAATQRAAATYSTLDNSMMRHGALSAEFIAAAARGEVTLKELGNQALVTAGKFGGWTAAATALFAALGAIHQIGQGAIDASSGVNTLRRVINNVDAGKAQQDFVDLSKQFNVPIGTAVDAVYRMGQVFHNQADATMAARAALYSYKTGEVDVATSTQNLIAIVNGAQLSASDLGAVYDQINQAQNTFGIRIGDTEAGLAKAIGTYRNAGGSLDYLLGLFIAIQKATGRSGTEIGTGISRGVNQIRQLKNQQKLAAQGVEVDPLNFEKTIKSAMRAARRPGADVQQLATGLFGNQYARLITPVLTDQRLLNRALHDTTPEKSKGSAQRELAKVLGQVDEQLSAVGHSLQRLGAELDKAGAGVGLGLLLHVLNGILNVTNDILGVFNKLPEPVRTLLTLMGEAMLVMRVMRRFAGGSSLAEGRLSFLARPDDRLRVFANRTAREATEGATTETAQLAARERAARFRAETARDTANQTHQHIATLQRTGQMPPEYSDEHLQLRQEQVEAENRARSLETEANRATADRVAQQKIALRFEEEQVNIGKLRGNALRRYLTEQNYAIPTSLQKPSLGGVETAPGRWRNQLRDDIRLSASGLPRNVTDDASARRLSLWGVQAEQAVRSRFNPAARAQAGGYERFGNSARLAEPMAGLAARSAGRGATMVEHGAQALRRGAGSLKGALGSIVAGFGPLDAIFLAFAAFEIIGPKLEEAERKRQDLIKKIEANPVTLRDQAKKVNLLRQQARNQGGPSAGEVGRGFLEELNPVNAFSAATGIGGYESPYQRRLDAAKLAQKEQRNLQAEIQRKAAQRSAGGPVGQSYFEEVRTEIDRNVQDALDGVISLHDLNKELDQRGVELFATSHIGPRGRAKGHELIAAARRQAAAILDPDNFRLQFGFAGADELRGDLANNTALLKRPGTRGSKLDFRRIAANFRYLMREERGAHTYQDLQKLYQDRDAYFSALEDNANRELEEGLLGARTEGQRTQAFARARRGLQRIPRADRTALDTARKRERSAQDRVQRDTEELARLQKLHPDADVRRPDGFGFASPFGDQHGVTTTTELKSAVERQRKKLKKDSDDLKKASKDSADAVKKYKEALHRRNLDLLKLKDQEYEDRQTGRDLNLQLVNSRTADQGDQAANSLKFAERQLQDAKRTYGVHDRRYKQALIAVNNAKMQVAQQLLADVEADNALLIAQAGSDPVAAARAAATAEANTLAKMRAHPRKFDSNDIKTQRARTIQANTAAADAVRQEAQEYASLQGQIAQARLGGPGGDALAAARAGQAAARRAMGYARTRVERAQALLDLINANNAVEEAIRDQEQARYELLEAQNAEDPVQVANLERRAANAAVKGTHGAARLRARAAAIRARDASRAAALQAKEDDIDFEQQMGRIDVQDAIDRYQALLKTKNLTKQQKRDLRLKIHGLQQEMESEASGFDLDVGSIKMPTIYDVKRAFDPIHKQMKEAAKQLRHGIGSAANASSDDEPGYRGARGAGTGHYNINHHVTDARRALVQARINVYVRSGRDAEKVYDAIDQAMGTHVKSKLRSRHHRRAR